MKKLFSLLLTLAMLAALAGCAAPAAEPVATPEPAPVEAPAQEPVVEPEPVEAPAEEALPPLPAAQPNPEDQFGVDTNINIGTIDQWLGRDDVEYVDVRMLTDPGCYESIGGDSMLSGTIEGFKVVPYPYLGTLTGLPPDVAATQYEGPCLFDVEFDETGAVSSIEANYLESENIINDLFPKDKAIFLMCGGGGYGSFTRNLLIALGYDPSMLYNIGGFWGYTGENKLEVLTDSPSGIDYYAFHRLNYHIIDFTQLRAAE